MSDDDHKDLVSEAMHELRYFNQRLKGLVENLTRSVRIDDLGSGQPMNMNSQHADQVRVTAEGILNISQLFSTRLNFIDFELNPATVESMPIVQAGIYGKFDRARRVLNATSREKKVKVKFSSAEDVARTFDAYPLIDMMPYLVLDNAVKYSPRESDVWVEFVNYKSSIGVEVRSIGPVVSDDEIARVFEKHFRGRGALENQIQGSGLGLFFVKKICDLHGIDAKVESGETMFNFDGISYSEFSFSLDVPV